MSPKLDLRSKKLYRTGQRFSSAKNSGTTHRPFRAACLERSRRNGQHPAPNGTATIKPLRSPHNDCDNRAAANEPPLK
ncbi:MAG: hypothetical protein ACK5ST_00685, partial [bacterium]